MAPGAGTTTDAADPHARQALARLGGVSTAAGLLAVVSRRQLRRALENGEIIRTGRDRYCLPIVDEARRASHALTGVASHASAAQSWGWELARVPQRPSVTVPRTRKIAAHRRDGIDVHWATLGSDDVHEWITSRSRTFLDCAKSMPYSHALAMADSALRHGMSRPQLVELAEAVPGRGRAACLRVARAADERAANPFESTLRAIGHHVQGLHLVPQVRIVDGEFVVRPDLVDEELRLVVEADSFAYHSDRAALRRDCARYTGLALLGWRVLRFSWEDVMLRPRYVLRCLTVAAARP